MIINGQSGAGMFDTLGPAVPVIRYYLIKCPPGMLAHGHSIKRFTSLAAFEGYIAYCRNRGFVVRWLSPFTAEAEASA